MGMDAFSLRLRAGVFSQAYRHAVLVERQPGPPKEH